MVEENSSSGEDMMIDEIESEKREKIFVKNCIKRVIKGESLI